MQPDITTKAFYGVPAILPVAAVVHQYPSSANTLNNSKHLVRWKTAPYIPDLKDGALRRTGVMTLTDIAVCRLPRIFTLSLIILGAAFRYSQDSLAHALLNASLWFGMIYLLRRIFLAVKGTEALGLGDVFLIAGIAMWTQPQHTPLIITAAASGAFLFILIFCRRRRQQALPFAPFLCASLYVLTLFPDSVIHTSEIFT